ncbi:MAG: hypothetical protein J5696_06365 [Lachnospiraceae bacterium]|nr:hypothetical protein [Lachnospiraceae bacterium]
MKRERILLLYDRDEEYAHLMGEYLLGCKGLPWKIAACTSAGDLLGIVNGRAPEVLVTSASCYDKCLEKIGAKHTIVLNDGTTGVHGVTEKYQPAENTLRVILDICAEDEDADGADFMSPAKDRAKLIGVFSPVRRCYQTTFSVLMGRLLSDRGRVLYLSFEFCEGCEELIPPEESRGLSDLMYFIKSPVNVFLLRFKSMVRSIAGLDYIPCALSGTDISDIPEAEWKLFLSRICDYGEYSYVILDLSESIRGIFSILRMCDRIYTLTRNDRVAKRKVESYENVLSLYNYEDVREKSIKCDPPSVNRVPSFSGDMSGEFVDFIAKQLGEI